jgi:hypothetical protein
MSNTIKKLNGDDTKAKYHMVALHSGIRIQEVSVFSSDVRLFHSKKHDAHMLLPTV